MLTFVKGHKEDLEGRVIAYVEPGLVIADANYTASETRYLSLVTCIMPGKVNIQNITNLEESAIKHSEGFDVIKGLNETGSSAFAANLLFSITSQYTDLFYKQLDRFKEKSEKYGSRFDRPQNLIQQEYNELVKKICFCILGSLNLDSDPNEYFSDLLYITKDAPFKERVLNLGNLVNFYQYTDKKEETKEIIGLYISQIFSILKNDFKEAQKIKVQIKEQTLKLQELVTKHV